MFVRVFLAIIFIGNKIILKIITTLIFFLWIFVGTKVVLLSPKKLKNTFNLLRRSLNSVVCSLIDNLLTIDSVELVVMSVDNQLAHIE